jgi:signal peptidase II
MVLLLLSLDLSSKMLALASIPSFAHSGYPFGGIPLFSLGPISGSLNLVANTGAAFGLFSTHSWALLAIRLLIIASLVGYLLLGKDRRLAWWLIVTGAFGNVLDTILYGHVVDFLHLCFWGRSFPVFNLADCWITFGVLGLLWASRAPKAALTP